MFSSVLGGAEPASFAEATLNGWAPDGGPLRRDARGRPGRGHDRESSQAKKPHRLEEICCSRLTCLCVFLGARCAVFCLS